jgi:hypothetical protein
MLQVVGIVLYYLVMVSSMLVDRQTGRSRCCEAAGRAPGR